MDAGTLYDAIIPVCPIIGTAVGDENDRATWTYTPEVGVTSEQIAAADNVVATIPATTKASDVPTSEFIGRFTNAEYLALEKKRRDDIAANKVGNAKNWDVVIADTLINMNKKKVETLKADLVTDGVLTQTRADEIFK